MSDPCQPTIDGTWKDFVVDYGGVSGSTSGASKTANSDALVSWLAYGVGQGTSAAKLYVPPGAYSFDTARSNRLTHGIKNATVSGWGADFDSSFIGSVAAIPEDQVHSARVQTILAGATSATLNTGGDVSKFSIGAWVLVCGLSRQNFGSPGNWEYNEFRQISNIAGSVISWLEPLTFTYLSTWPDLNPGTGADLAGPATVYALDSAFDTDANVFGLTFSQSAQFTASGRNILICGCAFTGQGISPTAGKSIVIRRTQIGSSIEVDKALEYVEFDTCTMIGSKQIVVQSSSCTNLVIKGGIPFDTMNGIAQNTTISGASITGTGLGGLVLGPTGYGHGNTLTILGTKIAAVRVADHSIDPSTVTFSAGTFTIANASASSVWAWAVPGKHYFFAFYDGSFHSSPDLGGGPVNFKITALRQDASNTYIDTDIGNVLPTPTFGGQAPNRYAAYPAELITQANSLPADASVFGFAGTNTNGVVPLRLALRL